MMRTVWQRVPQQCSGRNLGLRRIFTILTTLNTPGDKRFGNPACNISLMQWCGLRPSVLGQDRSETKKIGLGLARCGLGLDLGLVHCGLGLGLAGLVLCCETRSCHARHRNDLEGCSNVSNTIYSFSILCLEHHYCGDQQWRSLN